MEEGKQEIQEIEEIEEVEIVFGDVEPELLNNTLKQHFGEDAAAEEHKSVSSGSKEGLEANVLEPSMKSHFRKSVILWITLFSKNTTTGSLLSMVSFHWNFW